MKLGKIFALLVFGLIFVSNHTASFAAETGIRLDNTTCLSCHDGQKGKLDSAAVGKDAHKLSIIAPDKYKGSVHAKLECIACHKEIVDAQSQHKLAKVAKPDCAGCHEALAKTEAGKKVGMALAAGHIESYKNSFHARPNKETKSQVNATCNDCHDTHTFFVPPVDTLKRAEWRLATPAVCGETCHNDALDEYKSSVHGKATQENGNLKAAVCVDCHTTHSIGNTSANNVKLAITAQCGNCHEENLKTYMSTYHGQVARLGYAYTAKCYNCHGSHGILKIDDPESKVHVDNRLRTCRECHNGKNGLGKAPEGFLSFSPHANSHDFAKYPQVWIATKFMTALLIGVFAFFWLHSGLWYYREWQDRKTRKTTPHVRTAGMALDEKKFFQRFPLGWRIANLAFALITMTLVLTGTAALFSHTSWAPVVAQALGGARGLSLIHRISAALFIGIFFIHFVYVMQKLLRDRSFRWFGPDSLIPNWKDFTDCWGMFKWFVGKGEKPRFDRWAYFEKFDYWAVFWGVTIIGSSGMMLAFPHVTAAYVPGWVFNVATIVHGEEAFLAAVFLFTVHFFNNHFRPDKLPPPDIVMFTGTQSLEEFRSDHPAQYQRLVDSGELEKFMVDGPSQPMKLGSKILGLILIAFGLILLALVSIGFLSEA